MAKAIKALGLGTTTQNWGQGGEGKISGKITKVEANEKYIDVHYTISNFASYQQPIVIISHNTPSFLKNNALENNVNIWRFYNDPDDGYPLTFTVSLYYKNNIGNDKNLHLLDSKEYDIYTLLNKNDEHKKTVTNSNVNVVTYHIYWNTETEGKIEKHVPKTIDKGFERKIKYVYHDKNEKEHNLGYYKFLTINNKYGSNYQPNKDEKNIDLVNVEQIKNFLSDTLFFRFTINPNTSPPRLYMNTYTLASIFGAMLECSFNDFTYNGFSNENGESVGGSKSHKNGMNGDLRYLRIDKSGKNVHLHIDSETGDPCGWKGMDEIRQNKFNDALYKFGWKSMRSWRYNNKLLNHCTHLINHNHHLHIQDYIIPNYKLVKK